MSGDHRKTHGRSHGEYGGLDLDATLAATPMTRLGTAEEIASAVLWLCSPADSYVTGIALPVDGGYTAQ
jgi:NAD(P)-dependent dehydrogenase (short-subunit alcohol dehydrogenase family)